MSAKSPKDVYGFNHSQMIENITIRNEMEHMISSMDYKDASAHDMAMVVSLKFFFIPLRLVVIEAKMLRLSDRVLLRLYLKDTGFNRSLFKKPYWQMRFDAI